MVQIMEEKENNFEEIAKVLDVHWCPISEEYIIKYENEDHSKEEFCFN